MQEVFVLGQTRDVDKPIDGSSTPQPSQDNRDPGEGIFSLSCSCFPVTLALPSLD